MSTIGPIKVLIADDDANTRYIVGALLNPIQYIVRGAQDGLEAIKVINDWRPNVILLDMIMPKLYGADIIGLIRSNPIHDGCRIIVMATGKLHGDTMLDVDGVLAKPFTYNQLMEVIGVCHE